jgi:hypothetical protein
MSHQQYQLRDKEYSYGFVIKPIKKIDEVPCFVKVYNRVLYKPKLLQKKRLFKMIIMKEKLQFCFHIKGVLHCFFFFYVLVYMGTETQ